MLLFCSEKATTLTVRGSSKQNQSPMTDHSRYNCYEGESREGNIKSKRMIKVWGKKFEGMEFVRG